MTWTCFFFEQPNSGGVGLLSGDKVSFFPALAVESLNHVNAFDEAALDRILVACSESTMDGEVGLLSFFSDDQIVKSCTFHGCFGKEDRSKVQQKKERAGVTESYEISASPAFS